MLSLHTLLLCHKACYGTQQKQPQQRRLQIPKVKSQQTNFLGPSHLRSEQHNYNQLPQLPSLLKVMDQTSVPNSRLLWLLATDTPRKQTYAEKPPTSASPHQCFHCLYRSLSLRTQHQEIAILWPGLRSKRHPVLSCSLSLRCQGTCVLGKNGLWDHTQVWPQQESQAKLRYKNFAQIEHGLKHGGKLGTVITGVDLLQKIEHSFDFFIRAGV